MLFSRFPKTSPLFLFAVTIPLGSGCLNCRWIPTWWTNCYSFAWMVARMAEALIIFIYHSCWLHYKDSNFTINYKEKQEDNSIFTIKISQNFCVKQNSAFHLSSMVPMVLWGGAQRDIVVLLRITLHSKKNNNCHQLK